MGTRTGGTSACWLQLEGSYPPSRAVRSLGWSSKSRGSNALPAVMWHERGEKTVQGPEGQAVSRIRRRPTLNVTNCS
jgi:hypothetical protein